MMLVKHITRLSDLRPVVHSEACLIDSRTAGGINGSKVVKTCTFSKFLIYICESQDLCPFISSRICSLILLIVPTPPKTRAV